MFLASTYPSSGENCCIYATLVFVTLYGWRLVCWLDWNQPADQTPLIQSDNYQWPIDTTVSPDDGHVVVLYSVITNLEVRGNITTRLKQICTYADDIVIIGRTKQILIDTFCKLKHEALNAGLRVNNNKTKYLYSSRKIFQPTYLNTGEEQFEQVNSFKYSGSTVNTDNSIEEESKERILAGNRAYHVPKKLFTSKLISRNF